MIEQLREKAGKQEEMETQFLLSDQAYAKATIPPTDKVASIFSSGAIPIILFHSEVTREVFISPVWVIPQFKRGFEGTKNSNNLYLQLLCQLCPHRTSIFRCAG